MRILVLRGGALGDFLVTLPALRLLRERWPDARIELAGNAAAGTLGVADGVIDAVHSQHEARWAALYSEQPMVPTFADWLAEFDLVVNYWPDPDGTLGRRFPIRDGQRFLAAAAQPAVAPAARHFCAPLHELGLSTTDFRSRLALHATGASRPHETSAFDFDLRPGTCDLRPVIAIHPGSGSSRKNWPAERWVELLRRIDGPMLLVLGEAERDFPSKFPIDQLGANSGRKPAGGRMRAAGEIATEGESATSAASGPPTHRESGRMPVAGDLSAHRDIRMVQNLPLPTLAAALAGCRRFVGHDSGVSHLAAAVGTPCLLLFGPTDPAMWAPPGAHVRVLRRGDSLDAINVDEVLAALAA